MMPHRSRAGIMFASMPRPPGGTVNMAISWSMATPRVKSTYSLDLETVQALDDLARRWGVPKSEALRRAIRAAADAEGGVMGGPLAALDALQASARLSPAKANTWARQVRTERDTGRPTRR
jgi:hypothetical protein